MNPNDDQRKAFGAWLTQRLDQRGRGTLSQLARALHRTPQAVIDYREGRRIPRAWEIGQIAAFFDADPVEVAELAGRDPLEAEQAFTETALPVSISATSFLDEVHFQLNIAHKLRDLGDPQSALDVLNRWIGYVEQRLDVAERAVQVDKRYIKDIQALYVRSLNDRMRSMNDVTPSPVIAKTSLDDYKKAALLSKEIGDTREEARAYSLRANAYYVAHDSVKASEFAKMYAATIGTHLPHVPGERILLLAPAYLGKPSDFIFAEKSIFNLIDLGRVDQPHEQSLLLEAMGHARAILRLEDAETRLDAAQQAHLYAAQSGVALPLRQIQIVRSKLILQKSVTNPELDYAEAVAREGIQLAQQHSYKRHEQQIRNLLKSLNIVLEAE